MRTVLCLLGLVLVGCESSDLDTDPQDIPDIAGRYNVILAGTAGCDNDPALLADWAAGPLSVDGDGTTLTFDFGDGMVFSGGVDADYSYSFGGLVTVGASELSVFSDGIVFVQDGGWNLDGNISAIVDEDTSQECTIGGPYEAFQL